MSGILNETLVRLAYAQVDIVSFTAVGLGTCIIGFLTNFYTLVLLIRRKAFSKPHYTLIVCVGVADFLSNFIFIPIETLQSYWRISKFQLLGDDFFCSFEGCIYAFCYWSSIIGQMLIAINRAVAVLFPLFYQSKVTNKSALISFFVFALFLSIFINGGGQLAGFIDFKIDEWGGDCMEGYNFVWFRNLATTFGTYVPLAVSFLAYISILIRILSTTAVTERQTYIKRAKGSLAMFANMLFFAFCILPLWISMSADKYYSGSLSYALWVKYIYRSSLAVNPVS